MSPTARQAGRDNDTYSCRRKAGRTRHACGRCAVSGKRITIAADDPHHAEDKATMFAAILSAALLTAPGSDTALEPWASKAQPGDVAKSHVENITAGELEYV